MKILMKNHFRWKFLVSLTRGKGSSGTKRDELKIHIDFGFSYFNYIKFNMFTPTLSGSDIDNMILSRCD